MSPAPDEGGPGSRRATAVNAGWLVSERVVGMFATAAVAIVLGRMLGTEAFGAYSASLSLVLILSEISEMGFALLVPQELLARPRRERPAIVASSLRIRVVVSTVAFVPALLLSWFLFLEDYGEPAAALLLASLPLVRAFEVYPLVHMAFERGASLVRARVVSSVLAAAGLAAFVWSGSRSLAAAAAIDLARYLPFVTVLWWSSRTLVPRGRYRPDEARSLLRRALPLTLPVVAGAISIRIGQVLLGILSTDSQVGIYAAATRVAETVYFLPAVITAALLPRLIEAKRRGRSSYRRAVTKSYSLMWALGIAVGVGTFVSADWIVPLVFGSEYAESADVLRVLALAMPFAFARWVHTRWLLIEDEVSLTIVTHGSSVLVIVPANLLLIPSYGAMGAAWATVLAWLVSSYLILYLHPVMRVVATNMNRGLVQLPANTWEVLAGLAGRRRRYAARRVPPGA